MSLLAPTSLLAPMSLTTIIIDLISLDGLTEFNEVAYFDGLTGISNSSTETTATGEQLGLFDSISLTSNTLASLAIYHYY